jgi:hypothetical protein
MTAEPAPSRTNLLTAEVFGSFLKWLSSDCETAATRYLELRRKLVRFFVCKSCAHAEELADRTLDRVAIIVNKEPEKYSQPTALCVGVAKKVWLEYHRERQPEPLETENIPAKNPELWRFREHESNCLSSCVNRLGERERELIEQYHGFRGHERIDLRKRLAQEYGGLNKLRIMTYRIRCRLYECIQGCVEQGPIQ